MKNWLKLRFHLCEMRLTNANVTPKNRKHRISIGWFHLCECKCKRKCKVRRWQNELLHVAIGPNANVLSDWKSLHTHSRPPQSSTRLVQGERKLHWSPNIVRHPHLSSYSHYKWNLSLIRHWLPNRVDGWIASISYSHNVRELLRTVGSRCGPLYHRVLVCLVYTFTSV